MWIFGYGSLMWAPGFDSEQILSARVFGWHRRFSLISTRAWGSEELPGLCAALHPGGTAWGRIFKVSAAASDAVLAYLDRREAAYIRRQVVVWPVGARRSFKATTYVIDPAHPRYGGEIAPARARQMVRQGHGEKGSSRGYIRDTVGALEADGHKNTDAHRFFDMIAADN